MVKPRTRSNIWRGCASIRRQALARDYGLRQNTPSRRPIPTAPAPAIPGRAAGERSCGQRRQPQRIQRRRAATTNNRMELMAAISALEALKRPARSVHTDANICETASPSGCMAGSATAGDRRQEAGEERRSMATPRRRAHAHQVEWSWVKGHAAMPKTTGSTRSPARRSPPSGLLRRRLRWPLGRHRLLLGHWLIVMEVEHLLRAVAGIVAFDQAPDIRFARAAEVQRPAHFARRSLLHLGNPERDLASYLHMTCRCVRQHRRWQPNRPRCPARPSRACPLSSTGHCPWSP